MSRNTDLLSWSCFDPTAPQSESVEDERTLGFGSSEWNEVYRQAETIALALGDLGEYDLSPWAVSAKTSAGVHPLTGRARVRPPPLPRSASITYIIETSDILEVVDLSASETPRESSLGDTSEDERAQPPAKNSFAEIMQLLFGT